MILCTLCPAGSRAFSPQWADWGEKDVTSGLTGRGPEAHVTPRRSHHQLLGGGAGPALLGCPCPTCRTRPAQSAPAGPSPLTGRPLEPGPASQGHDPHPPTGPTYDPDSRRPWGPTDPRQEAGEGLQETEPGRWLPTAHSPPTPRRVPLAPRGRWGNRIRDASPWGQGGVGARVCSFPMRVPRSPMVSQPGPTGPSQHPESQNIHVGTHLSAEPPTALQRGRGVSRGQSARHTSLEGAWSHSSARTLPTQPVGGTDTPKS